MYVVPTTWTSLSARLVFDVVAVVVALAKSVVEVPLTSDSLDVAAVVVMESERGCVELPITSGVPDDALAAVEVLAVASTTGVDVPITVDVASVRAATMPVLNVPIIIRVAIRTLAIENAIVWVFIQMH